MQGPSRGSRQLVLKDLKLTCADTSLNDQSNFILGFNLLLIPLSFILASYVCIFACILSIHSPQGTVKSFATCASHITVVTMFYGPVMITYMRPRSWYDTVLPRLLQLPRSAGYHALFIQTDKQPPVFHPIPHMGCHC